MKASVNINEKVLTSTLRYELTTSRIDDSEQMSYTTYGIRVKDESENILLEYADISTSKELVREFLELVEDRDVSVIHIPDLLEDFLD